MPTLQGLFRQLAGPAFERLPGLIQRVHTGAASATFSGACDVERGRHWLARLAGRVAGMPSAARQIPLRVRIDADAAGEVWTRHFGSREMRSRLQARDGLLIEQLGPLTVAFELVPLADCLRWIPRGGRVLGIPLPARFFSQIHAVECTATQRYTFEVRAALPFMGLIVHYRGWLEPDA